MLINNKLNKQILSIQNADFNTQQRNRITWLDSYKNRRQFIDNLNKEIKDKVLIEKEKSKYYSDAVVEYDKTNMRVF